ncbi:MAG: class I SAM-dependent methyltransferase [Promethearchaeota archaeon]
MKKVNSSGNYSPDTFIYKNTLLKFMDNRGEKSFITLPKFAAKLYDKMMQLEPLQIQRSQIAELLLQQINEGSLLDVGTGHGRLLIEINKLNPKIELYGLDISEKMINLAKTNLKDIKADLQQGNITNTNYKSNYFDIITCTGSFYLWNSPIEGLNEIHRILKPNKIALLFESHKDYDKSNLKKEIKKNLSKEGFFNRRLVPYFLNKQLKMTYDINELKNILNKSLFENNFSIKKITLANLPIWLKIELTKE